MDITEWGDEKSPRQKVKNIKTDKYKMLIDVETGGFEPSDEKFDVSRFRIVSDVGNGKTYHPNHIYIKVVEILVDKLGVNGANISLETNIGTDLGADSLDLVELIMEVEKEFNIVISDDEAEVLHTVGSAIDYIAEATGFPGTSQPKEIIPKSNVIDYETKEIELIKDQRILTTIRRLRLKEDAIDRAEDLSGFKGDIFEELHNEPNVFINVTKIARHRRKSKIYITAINLALSEKSCTDFSNYIEMSRSNVHNLNAAIDRRNDLLKSYLNIEVIDSIDVLDSELLDSSVKKSGQIYKRKLKQLAKLNEDLTNLKYILQVEDED